MLYLFDANVLISASNYYYRIDAVPEFWAWIAHYAERGNIKMPSEIFDEVKDGTKDENVDLLFNWIQEHKAVLVLDEEPNVELVRRVTEGYAPDLTDDELEVIGRDPFLIAAALVAPNERCVVTTEVSSARKTRQNRRIPDLCTQFGVTCCDTFAVTTALQFSTKWQA